MREEKRTDHNRGEPTDHPKSGENKHTTERMALLMRVDEQTPMREEDEQTPENE